MKCYDWEPRAQWYRLRGLALVVSEGVLFTIQEFVRYHTSKYHAIGVGLPTKLYPNRLWALNCLMIRPRLYKNVRVGDQRHTSFPY